MATFNVKAPVKGLSSPTSWYAKREDLVEQTLAVYNKYKDYLKFASATSKIPVPILLAFIMVESNGDPNAGGKGHVTQGLMQWNRNYAKAQLEQELEKGRLSPAERTKLGAYQIVFDKNGKTRNITNADQVKPELNILIGSIILGQLMDESWATFAGNLRLDRVIAVYNAGAFGDTGKKARLGDHATPVALAADVNTITRAYINKILGSNGALDVITTSLKSQIQQS
jgi:hypothetical protein